jgi:chromosome segregation ATPase
MYNTIIIIVLTIFFLSLNTQIENFSSQDKCVENCKKKSSSNNSNSQNLDNVNSQINQLKQKQAQIVINQSNISNKIDSTETGLNNKINNVQTQVNKNTEFRNYINNEIEKLKKEIGNIED